MAIDLRSSLSGKAHSLQLSLKLGVWMLCRVWINVIWPLPRANADICVRNYSYDKCISCDFSSNFPLATQINHITIERAVCLIRSFFPLRFTVALQHIRLYDYFNWCQQMSVTSLIWPVMRAPPILHSLLLKHKKVESESNVVAMATCWQPPPCTESPHNEQHWLFPTLSLGGRGGAA